MRHWFGIVFALGGAWLLYAGFKHRERVLASRQEGAASAGVDGPLGPFAAILRPLIIVAVVYFGIKATVIYALVDAGAVFSLIDLVGLWLLLASYAVWLVLKTTHRAVASAAPGVALSSVEPGRPAADVGPSGPRGTAARRGSRARLRGVGGRVPETGQAASGGPEARREIRAARHCLTGAIGSQSVARPAWIEIEAAHVVRVGAPLDPVHGSKALSAAGRTQPKVT